MVDPADDRMIDPARVYRVPEAADRVGVASRTYYAAYHRGEVPGVRIGRRIVVPGAALARFLAGTNGGGTSTDRHSEEAEVP